jgi:hypothetical protein
MFTEAEAIRGEKPGMTARGAGVDLLGGRQEEGIRDLPVMLFLPKTPSL